VLPGGQLPVVDRPECGGITDEGRHPLQGAGDLAAGAGVGRGGALDSSGMPGQAAGGVIAVDHVRRPQQHPDGEADRTVEPTTVWLWLRPPAERLDAWVTRVGYLTSELILASTLDTEWYLLIGTAPMGLRAEVIYPSPIAGSSLPLPSGQGSWLTVAGGRVQGWVLPSPPWRAAPAPTDLTAGTGSRAS
jgi:hypothetical protein